MARGLGDLVERTGADGGDAMTSKKGDLVITIDPTRTRGTSLRIVVEAKDRPMPLGRMTKELAEARVNRSAAIAMAVFTPHTAPTAVAPLALVGLDVFATYDPEADDAVALEAAYRAARSSPSSPLATPRSSSTRRPSPARSTILAARSTLCAARETKLTHIGSTAREVSDALDILRAGVLRSVGARDTARGRRGRLGRPHGLSWLLRVACPACPDSAALVVAVIAVGCNTSPPPSAESDAGHTAAVSASVSAGESVRRRELTDDCPRERARERRVLE